jgi:hypothetical protein
MQILFVCEKSENASEDAWNRFVSKVSDIPENKSSPSLRSMEVLSLIQKDYDGLLLSKMISAAEVARFPYKLIFIKEYSEKDFNPSHL